MEGRGDEWEDLVERLARDLTQAVRRRLYDVHLDRIRGMGAPSEKLVYLYLVLAEPQTFTGVRQGLDIGVKTVDRALRSLRERGYVVQDRRYLYWVESLERWGNHMLFSKHFFRLLW